MKRTLRASSRAAAKRRRLRRRSTGAVLTFATHSEINAAVLYMEADARTDARPYPDALSGTRDSCVSLPL